jgi:hypothetical protein
MDVFRIQMHTRQPPTSLFPTYAHSPTLTAALECFRDELIYWLGVDRSKLAVSPKACFRFMLLSESRVSTFKALQRGAELIECSSERKYALCTRGDVLLKRILYHRFTGEFCTLLWGTSPGQRMARRQLHYFDKHSVRLSFSYQHAGADFAIGHVVIIVHTMDWNGQPLPASSAWKIPR